MNRPSIDTDEYDEPKSHSKGNKYYFYIEYYNDEDTFNRLISKLKGNMRTLHEIEPIFFRDLIDEI